MYIFFSLLTLISIFCICHALVNKVVCGWQPRTADNQWRCRGGTQTTSSFCVCWLAEFVGELGTSVLHLADTCRQGEPACNQSAPSPSTNVVDGGAIVSLCHSLTHSRTSLLVFYCTVSEMFGVKWRRDLEILVNVVQVQFLIRLTIGLNFTITFRTRKLEYCCYRKLCETFRYNTQTWKTDGQTDTRIKKHCSIT